MLPRAPKVKVKKIVEAPIAETIDSVFKVVDVMPEFQGGTEAMIDYLSNNITYPKSAKDDGISGKVYIHFVIDTDGKVIDTKVKKSLREDFDEVALHAINQMPDWIPGVHNGKKVKVEMVLPIAFQLQ